MSAFDRLFTPAFALAIAACVAAGSATAAALHDADRAPTSLAARRALAQASPQMKRAPSVFQGIMIPGVQRERACRSPKEIHNRLKRQGWWDFDDLEREGGRFTVHARRPNGAAYELTIDGCSGRVLGAMRLDGAQRGYRLWPR